MTAMRCPRLRACPVRPSSHQLPRASTTCRSSPSLILRGETLLWRETCRPESPSRTEHRESDGYELNGTPSKPGVYKFTLVASNLFGTSHVAVALRVIPAPGTFDVNGDGRADLPVGVPGEDVGSTVDAGQVLVLLGAADGTFGREGAVAISQETVGQRSERGDRFGAAVATGEVTGDNYVDLIIGMPGEDKGAGQVIVMHGSAKGLVGAKRTVLRQGMAGAAGAAESGDGFGAAISVGDGLWVGAPGEDLGRATNAGWSRGFWPLHCGRPAASNTSKVVVRFPVSRRRAIGSVRPSQAGVHWSVRRARMSAGSSTPARSSGI